MGEYKDGKRHGYGIFTKANGETQKGEFKNGEFVGQQSTADLANQSSRGVVIDDSQTGALNEQVIGKFYALIIGNNEYADSKIGSLDEPIKDAQKVYDVLTTKYTFDKNNIRLLKNADFDAIMSAFDFFEKTVTPSDNFLIFYAGHGHWDSDKELGYWLPIDAVTTKTAQWIRNSTITEFIRSIDSKHTLLISDACFSGSIFKVRSAMIDATPAINELYKMPSRKAMSSGNLKVVPDKSVFCSYLTKRLQENTDKYLPVSRLFNNMKEAVMNNSPTAPQFGVIHECGDQGGEFIFIRR
jgi:hypothetical protein